MSKFKDRKARNQESETQAPESPVETSAAESGKTEEVAPVNNFAEAAAKLEASGIEPIAPIEPVTTNKRGVLPDAFGNTVKGERICSVCGIKESETLAKNPRYSFCKGKCVNCYGKTERKTTKPSELTIPQIEEKLAYYRDLLQKKLSGAQGLSEGNATENATANTNDTAAVASGANVVSEDNAETLAQVER
jgi:hypothetical protein